MTNFTIAYTTKRRQLFLVTAVIIFATVFYRSSSRQSAVVVVVNGFLHHPTTSRWLVTNTRNNNNHVVVLQQQQNFLLSSSNNSNNKRKALVPTSAFILSGHGKNRRSSSSALFASSLSSDYDEVCDVLVLGSGPAARAIASLVSAQLSSTKTKRIILADQNIDREWAPNYGVWQDEWESIVNRYKNDANIGLTGGRVGMSIDRAWDVTDCYFGGSFDIPTNERLRINRPYYRIDKNALKGSLTTGKYDLLYASHISTAIGLNIFSPPNSLMHDENGSTILLQAKSGKMLTVRTKLIIDCTGHESALIVKEAAMKPARSPGFQIAYGAVVDVDERAVKDKTQFGPYDKEAMTLFDYRTDHYDVAAESEQKKLYIAPTFMYVMPLQENQLFIEETSLVARPGVSFQECKDRCYRRMEYLGIKVTKIHEEEFCYIPMGGALPEKRQRIVALGGSAGMVHPATGYHLCRCLMGAADVSRVVSQALQKNEKKEMNLDQITASCYHALWTPENIRQRNFAVFGGEFLMKQTVVGLRGFFDGFFRLPIGLWSGFLAGWPGLPNNQYHETWYNRLWFGLNFVLKLPGPVAIDLLGSIVSYMITEGVPLPQSVTPLLGQPESYEYRRNKDRIGDVAAKQEAKRMIMESKLGQEVPVDFINKSNDKERVAEIVVEEAGSFQ